MIAGGRREYELAAREVEIGVSQRILTATILGVWLLPRHALLLEPSGLLSFRGKRNLTGL